MARTGHSSAHQHRHRLRAGANAWTTLDLGAMSSVSQTVPNVRREIPRPPVPESEIRITYEDPDGWDVDRVGSVMRFNFRQGLIDGRGDGSMCFSSSKALLP
jgi:hypothetical protein